MTQLALGKSTPLFSIIMPTYNAGGYIAKSIASVIAQTCQDWELVIIDDASIDNTEEVVQAIAANEPRIRYEKLEPMRMPSLTRNAAIRRARGKYLTYLDADDLYEPDALEKFLTYFKSHKSSRAVYGQYVEINQYDQEIANEYAKRPLTPNWKTLLTAKTHHQLQALAMERALIDEIGDFREDVLYSEDWLFFIELLNHLGDQLGCIPDQVFRYRIYDKSISRDCSRAFQVLDSMDDLFRAFKQASLCDEARKYLSDFIASNYVYFFITRIQHHQWKPLVCALLKSFFNFDLKMIGWLRCLWVCFKTFLPKSFQEKITQFKTKARPNYPNFKQVEV